MNIRKATLADFDKINKIYKDHFEHDDLFFPLLNLSYPDTDDGKEDLVRNIVRSDSILLVIEDNDLIKGYLTGAVRERKWRKEPKVAELDGIYLDKDLRGQGWGSKLVEEFKKFAKEKEASSLKVMTNYTNKIARSFYEKNGFTEYAAWYEQKI